MLPAHLRGTDPAGLAENASAQAVAGNFCARFRAVRRRAGKAAPFPHGGSCWWQVARRPTLNIPSGRKPGGRRAICKCPPSDVFNRARLHIAHLRPNGWSAPARLRIRSPTIGRRPALVHLREPARQCSMPAAGAAGAGRARFGRKCTPSPPACWSRRDNDIVTGLTKGAGARPARRGVGPVRHAQRRRLNTETRPDHPGRSASISIASITPGRASNNEGANSDNAVGIHASRHPAAP